MILSKINFPQKDNNGHDLTFLNKLLQKELCQSFGGCTVSSGFGSWVNQNNKLYSEPVNIFEVATKASPKVKTALKRLAVKFGKMANQEAVYFVYNNKPEIVDLYGKQ